MIGCALCEDGWVFMQMGDGLHHWTACVDCNPEGIDEMNINTLSAAMTTSIEAFMKEAGSIEARGMDLENGEARLEESRKRIAERENTLDKWARELDERTVAVASREQLVENQVKSLQRELALAKTAKQAALDDAQKAADKLADLRVQLGDKTALLTRIYTAFPDIELLIAARQKAGS